MPRTHNSLISHLLVIKKRVHTYTTCKNEPMKIKFNPFNLHTAQYTGHGILLAESCGLPFVFI